VREARFAKNYAALLASLPRVIATRHCHASLLDAVGAPLGTVQAQLGHASSEVTRQIYLQAIPAQQGRAVKGVERLVIDIGPKRTQISEVVRKANL
jgi:integrase